MPKYILVAVDGTGSHEWFNGGNSYTRKFFEQFNTLGGWKMYMHGPDDTMTGRDAKQRIQDAKVFIEESIRSINADNGNFEYGPQSLPGGYSAIALPSIGRLDVTDIEFVFVGHSRGGAIVIELARSLLKKARFMGLYDAVDMSFWIDASEIKNVKTVYHATRKGTSRYTWGNAGTTRHGTVEEYIEVRFQTSHGGVNGGYELNPSGFGSDYSCAIYTPPKTYVNGNPAVYGRMGMAYYSSDQWKKLQKELSDKNKKEVENCVQDSMSADSFVRAGATWAGLTFDGTEMQSIMFDKSDGHIRKR